MLAGNQKNQSESESDESTMENKSAITSGCSLKGIKGVKDSKDAKGTSLILI